MPRRDGTGPTIGRGMGLCNANKAIGDSEGLGFRRRFGCRRGFGRNIDNTEDKKELLMEQKVILENRLNLLNKELDMVENDK